jgi:1-acyl-sn-glycerol-3-phosphate acyltransferase
MDKIFIAIYDYFSSRKSALILLLAGILSLSLYFASCLTFEEDISKIMPADEGISAINDIFENTDFADRLVLLVSFTDSTYDPPSPDELVSYVREFENRLPTAIDTASIADIVYRIDESKFQDVYNVLYDHLPLFLNSSDYDELESRTHPDSIQAFMQGIYKSLLTPGSSFIKKYVLRDPLGFTSLALNRIQEFQLDDNFKLQDGHIVTNDNKNLIFFIKPTQSSKETHQNAGLISGLDQLISTLETEYTQINTTYFGGVAVAVENAQQVRRDVTRTVSIALIVLLGLILYFFRRIPVFFFMVIPTLMGGLLALACMFVFKGEVSIIAIGIGSVLLGITLDYALHVFTHHRKTLNPRLGLQDLSMSIMISSSTTAAAFLCLYLIRSEALRDLGLFAALSVVFASIFSLIILPHLTSEKSENPDRPDTWLDRLAKLSTTKPGIAILLLLSITSIACFYAPKVEFENDLNQMNYMSDKLSAAENKLNGITNATRRGVYLMSKASTLDQALENSSRIVSTLDSMKRHQLISDYSSVTSLLPSATIQQARIDRWNSFWSGDKKINVLQAISQESQALGFRANTFQQFDQLLQRNYIVQSSSSFQSIIDLVFPEYINQSPKGTSVLSIVRVNLDQTAGVYEVFSNKSEVNILDKGYLISRFVDILKSDFNRLVFWSLLIVFFILHFAYGRIELAFIAFLPVILSWVWTLALMAILGLKLNIVNVIITTFIFGLGIDYSIFVMRGLLQKYQTGQDHLPTYKTSIILSVITTLVGIGVMIFAKHPALRSIAAVSIIGILSVVLLAFILQPILFRWLIYKSSGQRREYPLTLGNTTKTIFIYVALVVGASFGTFLAFIVSLLFFIPLETRKYYIHKLIYYFGVCYSWISCTPHLHINNPHGETFEKPSVLISNHVSHIDAPLIFSLTPKLILLTKSWVYKFPLYHLICKLGDFFTVAEGIDVLIPKIRKRYENGYHISLFPEGSRSENDDIKRFRKGAFHIADELNADILPVHIHGSGRYLRKNSFWGQSNDITITIGKRIPPGSPLRTGSINIQAKVIGQAYTKQHSELKKSIETPYYFRRQLLENYVYKGSVLYYYMLVKIHLEKYYKTFDDLIPNEASIVDIGCGYGFMSYMLLFRSDQRNILGIDYDEQKIATANQCLAKNDRIQFVCGDIQELEIQPADVYILADILHYLPKENQLPILDRLLARLHVNGMIILRDGDSDLKKKHSKTKWTEIFSTGLGFNKTKNNLSFTSSSTLKAWATENHLSMECVEESDQTSNSIFVFRRLNDII